MERKILKFRRSELTDVLTTINDYNNGHDVTWPVDPVICSDGDGLELASSLHEWEHVFDIDGAMAWLGNDQIANREIEEIVEHLTPLEIEEMLGVDDIEATSVMILER